MFIFSVIFIYYPLIIDARSVSPNVNVDENYWIEYYKRAVKKNVSMIMSMIENYPGFKERLMNYIYSLDPDPNNEISQNNVQIGISYSLNKPNPTVYGVLFLFVYTQDGKYAGTANIYLTPNLNIDHIEYYIDVNTYGMTVPPSNQTQSIQETV